MPSRPAVPVRGYSFGDFSTASPASQQPGQRIDQELDRLSASIDELIDWTATVLGDSGGIKPGVTAPSGPAGLVWQGDWSSSTAYGVNDAVQYGGSSWICVQAHTNQTPTAGAYWNLVAQKGADSSATSVQDVTVNSSSTALTILNNGTGYGLEVRSASGLKALRAKGYSGFFSGDTSQDPTAPLGAYGLTGTAPPTAPSGTVFHGVGYDTSVHRVVFDAFANQNQFIARRSNGSAGSPSTLNADDLISQFGVAGHNGVGLGSTVVASHKMLAGGTWSSSSMPAYHVWDVTRSTTTSAYEGARLEASGTGTARFTVVGQVRAQTLEARGTGSTQGNVTIGAAAGIARALKIQTADVDRWQLRATTTSESGSNAGCNLALTRYSDAGSSLGDAFTVARDTGVVDFATSPTVGGSPIGVAIPTGTVIWVAASSAPAGYVKCNGAALSRTTYSDLFAAIGTTFGTGDGSTTFNVPDLRGEFIRGWDDGRGVDTPRTLGSAQSAAYASHAHSGSTSSDGAHTHTVDASNVSTFGAGTGKVMLDNTGTGTAPTTSSAGSHSHTFTTSSAGGSETRPRNVALLACIKI